MGFMDFYRRADIQVCMIGIVCFCCPGMFNALTGLGAGGRANSDRALVDTGNAAMYTCFAVVGFFGGTVTNKLGAKWTYFCGTFGYCLYAAALWVYDREANTGFYIAASIIMGICAGLLWAAEGAMMMAYATEETRGKYVAIFWIFFNGGGVVGGLIALGLNLTDQSSGGVSDTTYAVLVAIMASAAIWAALIVPPQYVKREDGSRIVIVPSPSWKQEFGAIFDLMTPIKASKLPSKGFHGIKVGSWIVPPLVFLIPMFFNSIFYYTYQFGTNSAYYSVRTRNLNNIMYWLMQIVGSLIMGNFLDIQRYSRKSKAIVGLGVVGVLFSAAWAGALVLQSTYTRESILLNPPDVDWSSPGFAGPFVLYCLFGVIDAMYQTYCYWVMGALENHIENLGRFAGFYKGIQSAGSAGSWAYDAMNPPLMNEAIVNLCLTLISFPFAYIVAKNIPDMLEPTDEDKSIEYSGEAGNEKEVVVVEAE